MWETEEDSERFLAERMVPALKELGIEGGPPLSYQEFDLPCLVHPGAGTA